MDFVTVPTMTMGVLFVFVVLEHGRREMLHFDVTEHPTAAWTSQQIREAFADREPTRYAIRDRDGVYGNLVHECIASVRMFVAVVSGVNSAFRRRMPKSRRRK